MAINIETIFEVLAPICGKVETYEHRGDIAIFIEPEDLLEAACELRDNSRTLFNQLIDVTAIDWYRREKRFEVNHFLYSHQYNVRLRLKVPLENYDEPHCSSVTSIWESANWYERETYDMYGIIFDGHPDMRRFYMPEDFVEPETGYPLYPMRKDFPLMGIKGSLPLPERPEHVNSNK
jgi:NADH-quinone oxidoreductase subunit C